MEIAILLATYNSEGYLEELLESLLTQSYKDFVCYVHDDGSTDRTLEILQSFKNNTDMIIHILDYPPTGSAKANFMSMLKYVKEPYIMFCDHDDVWDTNKISLSIEKIKSIEVDSRPVLVFSDLYVTDSQLNIIGDSFMEYTGIDPKRIDVNSLLLENVAPGCTMIANRALYTLADKLTNINNIPMHDHWFILIAATVGIIGYIEKATIFYRQHSVNELGAVKNKTAFERSIIIIKKIVLKEYERNMQEWISVRQRQAGEIIKFPGISKEDLSLLEGFYHLQGESKLKRVMFYYRNKVLRRKYNLWFLICC